MFAEVRKDCHGLLTDQEIDELIDVQRNRPLKFFSWMRKLLQSSHNLLSEFMLIKIDENISGLLRSWQSATVICTSPFPLAYAHLLQILQMLWCCTMPLSLTEKAANPETAIGTFSLLAV